MLLLGCWGYHFRVPDEKTTACGVARLYQGSRRLLVLHNHSIALIISLDPVSISDLPSKEHQSNNTSHMARSEATWFKPGLAPHTPRIGTSESYIPENLVVTLRSELLHTHIHSDRLANVRLCGQPNVDYINTRTTDWPQFYHPNNRSFVCRKFVLPTWALNSSHSDASINVTLTTISGTAPAMSSRALTLKDTFRPKQRQSEHTLKVKLIHKYQHIVNKSFRN